MKSFIPKTKFIWLDGNFVPFDKARIHLLNHSLHYGSAAFEGERFYKTSRGPAIFRLADHTKRFFGSAKTIGIKIPASEKEIVRVTKELIRKNRIAAGYIRPIVFYGAKMGLHPGGSPVHIGIAVWPWGAYLGEKPVKAKISPIMRLHPKSIFSHAKISGYYANSILATLEARREGFDEAILLDVNDFVAEGPGENVFMVKNRKLYTPAVGSILPGITRDTIMKLARDMKIPVAEKRITPKELRSADELFFTGTAAEVTPIGWLGKTKIGRGETGPITEKLRTMYGHVVHGEEKRYLRWLDFVTSR